MGNPSLPKVLGSPTPSPVMQKKGTKGNGPNVAEIAQEKRAEKALSQSFEKESHQGPDGMVRIPQGPFSYGDEKTKISIAHDYYMDMYPVTNAAYATFIEAGGYEKESHWSQEGWRWRKEENVKQPEYWNKNKWNRANHPVVGVSYYEAEAYAKWAGKRLPTEQEWEKAARGTDGREYPWGHEFDEKFCNSLSGREKEGTMPVDAYPQGQSPYGCYDMAGNVWEWCASGYDHKKKWVVLRGGSWGNAARSLRSSNRDGFRPSSRYFYFGFRCFQDAS